MLTMLSSAAAAARSDDLDERLACAFIAGWAQANVRGSWRKADKNQRSEQHKSLNIPPPKPVMPQLARDESQAASLPRSGRNEDPAGRLQESMAAKERAAKERAGRDMQSLGLGKLSTTRKTQESELIRRARSPHEGRIPSRTPLISAQIRLHVSPPPMDQLRVKRGRAGKEERDYHWQQKRLSEVRNVLTTPTKRFLIMRTLHQIKN